MTDLEEIAAMMEATMGDKPAVLIYDAGDHVRVMSKLTDESILLILRGTIEQLESERRWAPDHRINVPKPS